MGAASTRASTRSGASPAVAPSKGRRPQARVKIVAASEYWSAAAPAAVAPDSISSGAA